MPVGLNYLKSARVAAALVVRARLATCTLMAGVEGPDLIGHDLMHAGLLPVLSLAGPELQPVLEQDGLVLTDALADRLGRLAKDHHVEVARIGNPLLAFPGGLLTAIDGFATVVAELV